MRRERTLRLLRGLLTGRSRIVNPERHGLDETDLLEAMSVNMNRNDRALYNLLVCQRTLRWLCDRVDFDLRDRDVLEIGTSSVPGLPLVLLANGCRTYAATNVFQVDDFVGESYFRVVQLVLCGCLPIEPEAIEGLVEWRELDGERIAALRQDRFRNLSGRSADAIDLPDAAVDLVFSFSVLEHVEDPAAVLANAYRMLRPGGLMVSGIDLRDHRDFARPLDFLKLAGTEYRRLRPDGENRLRASDFLRLFREAGFREEWAGFQDRPPALLASGRTDQASAFAGSIGSLWSKRSLDQVEPWVDDAERAAFDPDFQKYGLEDLSVLVLGTVHRKPA